eukprot:1161963-Pelagomonas_calceolata.AAC.14
MRGQSPPRACPACPPTAPTLAAALHTSAPFSSNNRGKLAQEGPLVSKLTNNIEAAASVEAARQ